MNGNPHYVAAEDHLNSENMTSGTEFAKEYRELVLIEATLALAYEQRTASLIAKMTLNVQAAIAGTKLNASGEALQSEINTRLGLKD